jgi:hypothetical protein
MSSKYGMSSRTPSNVVVRIAFKAMVLMGGSLAVGCGGMTTQGQSGGSNGITVKRSVERGRPGQEVAAPVSAGRQVRAAALSGRRARRRHNVIPCIPAQWNCPISPPDMLRRRL